MPNYFKDDLVLVKYPFTDASASKVRPAIVAGTADESPDLIVIPLTSRTWNLLPGEFVLANWSASGLHVPTAVKRGLYCVEHTLVLKQVGKLQPEDAIRLKDSLRLWLGL